MDRRKYAVAAPHDLVQLLQLARGVPVLVHAAEVQPDKTLLCARSQSPKRFLYALDAKLELVVTGIVGVLPAVPSRSSLVPSQPAMADKHKEGLSTVDCSYVDAQVLVLWVARERSALLEVRKVNHSDGWEAGVRAASWNGCCYVHLSFVTLNSLVFNFSLNIFQFV